MQVTINLDTQLVISAPSPLRMKAGAQTVLAIAFTSGNAPASLPDDAVIEFGFTPQTGWTDGPVVYRLDFTKNSLGVYTGTVNCTTESLLSAFETLNVDCEVTWSTGGVKTRSATFAGIIEKPVLSDDASPTPDPELYPAPDEIALKTEVPKTAFGASGSSHSMGLVPDPGSEAGAARFLREDATWNEPVQFASAAEAASGNRNDLVMSPLAVAQWWTANLPGNETVALLGDGSWGLPDLSNYAGSIAGDGSNLTDVTGSQLSSPSGGPIYDTGDGAWQVNSSLMADTIFGSFNGDGSQLYNVFAQYAFCDEFGDSIAYNYVQQWGYYSGLSVGSADYAYSTDYSTYAYADNWGYPLYGAGNLPWDFFGSFPNPGDVVTFDGSSWGSSPGTPVPITVEDATARFALTALKTGWLVKQLDNRTVYQVLDPNDCGTELGWVSVGPFILVPENSEPLVIDDMTPALGATIHCTAGTWSDNPTSYAYRWKRNSTPIAGANTLTYTIAAADDGAALQCLVSATNAAGTGTDNAVIPVVVLTAPTNISAPAITPAGTPNVGDTLSLTSGTWTGYGFTTTYQWKRSGSAITGAIAATYTLGTDDAGQTITCDVTRTNIRGSAMATTAAALAITNLVAVNTAAPTLSAVNLFTGAVVTCSQGSWNYHPTSYSYQWRRDGGAIAGATGSTYTVVSDDVGHTISCAVAATNPGGTSAAVASAESWEVTSVVTSSIRGALADSSLIAHWSLDEASGTRYDLTGNGIHLTPAGTGGTITNASGKFGMAANIPAKSYLSATDIRFATAKTICGWFKLSAANNSYQRLLVTDIQVYAGSSGIAWDRTHFTTKIVPTPGQWYFICLVSTGTAFKLWVNTQSFTVQTVTAGTPLIGSTFTIADPNYESVSMLFDDVACWNRALTDTEIATLAAG